MKSAASGDEDEGREAHDDCSPFVVRGDEYRASHRWRRGTDSFAHGFKLRLNISRQ